MRLPEEQMGEACEASKKPTRIRKNGRVEQKGTFAICVQFE
jgi:hypothetical protein